MNETKPAEYRMNPSEDTVLFGDELKEGMWVLPENPNSRQPNGGDEDSRMRRQRFRRITRLRREAGRWGNPDQTVFIGEWVDGYREIHSYAVSHGWIVKKDPQPEDGTAEL